MKKTMMLVFTLVWMVAACAPEATAEPTITAPLTMAPTLTASPIATQTEIPTSTPDFNHLDPAAILFEQNFEAGKTEGLKLPWGDWTIVGDDKGNNSLCNKAENNYSVILFGKSWWKNYAIEVQIKEQEMNTDPYVQLMIRNDQSKTSISEGYYGALNFKDFKYELAFSYPEYKALRQGTAQLSISDPISLRLEAAGIRIKYFINNQLVADKQDSGYSQGNAELVISPGLSICIDNIRAWALTETGAIGKAPTTIASSLEIVTGQAVPSYILTPETQVTGGIGGNNWGGHQNRIVRTADGVFTTYITAGSSDFDRKWQLARRQEDGSWLVIAHGDAGKDPVHLLASPDGTLHIIGWPGAVGTMWSGKPKGNQLNMTRETIPGVAHDNWPYSAASIDAAGDLCVLSTQGGKPGLFQWACYLPGQVRWISQRATTDYGFRYSYIFPDPQGGLSIIATRDVLVTLLGYKLQPNTFQYQSNAIGYWRTDDIVNKPVERLFFMEEKPTDQFPSPILNACQNGAYIDTAGNIHIIYAIQGESTQGAYVTHHAILSPNGEVLSDVLLPYDLGIYSRIFQDTKGQFYILGSSGDLYPAGKDGLTLGTPYRIDLTAYPVEYSGIYISAPRSGTPISNVVDVVYPSDNGTKWIYFQITLPEN